MLKALFSLLSPHHEKCIICQQPCIDPHRYDKRICSTCVAQIPYIVNVHCAQCGRAVPCVDCRRRAVHHFKMNRSAVVYDETVRQWLALYKYRGQEQLRFFLGQLLYEGYIALRQQVQHNRALFAFTAVVPVPLSEERLNERGFNQAEQLSADLAKRARLPVVPLLRRVRHSEKQSLQRRATRVQAVKNLFAIDEHAWANFQKHIHNMKVIRLLIVDDIYTTGSTIHACSEVLQTVITNVYEQLQVEIYSVTLARS